MTTFIYPKFSLSFDSDKVHGIIWNAANSDLATFRKNFPIYAENYSQSIVDDSVRANADFQYKAGLEPKIVRIAERKCCEWCSNLEGEYPYHEVKNTGNDVFRRHDNCRCTVVYMPIKGNAINAWNKVEIDRDEILTRRKIGSSGQEIIDKPTYNKLTKKFVNNGGIIIRGKEAEEHLKNMASAAYLEPFNTAIIKNDATISDVLEEMHHAEQARIGMYNDYEIMEKTIRREIEAQEYLIKNAKRYKIPLEEIEQTKKALEYYKEELKKFA